MLTNNSEVEDESVGIKGKLRNPNLPKCCMDFDVNPIDLLVPSKLSKDGFAFLMTHGIFEEPLAIIIYMAEIMQDGMVKIKHRCKQLSDNGCCKIYDTRPVLCKEFDCSTRVDCACKGSGRICQNSVS
jgi:Fe-S-cluster containining protein